MWLYVIVLALIIAFYVLTRKEKFSASWMKPDLTSAINKLAR